MNREQLQTAVMKNLDAGLFGEWNTLALIDARELVTCLSDTELTEWLASQEAERNAKPEFNLNKKIDEALGG